MHAFEQVFSGRRVLVTGHTGFKGSWLCLWLSLLGARVHGLALEPDTEPSLFTAAKIAGLVSHEILDIRRSEMLIDRIAAIDPEVVFHLAAQPLVRRSYEEPLETFEINVLGTAYLLEACRRTRSTRAIVCVTTDKVYQNQEWIWPYRENDPLEGKDPYSASKAAAEIVAACYRQTMNARGNKAALATARGGNIIGGGDWSQDRLIPDLVRAIAARQPLAIRNPNATRPWQHVLALCHGYLALAAGLVEAPARFEGPWNFSPGPAGTVTVRRLLDMFGEAWQLPDIISQEADGKPEAQLLALDSSKAETMLGWQCPWPLATTVRTTAEWYKGFAAAPGEAQALMRSQIEAYRGALGGE